MKKLVPSKAFFSVLVLLFFNVQSAFAQDVTGMEGTTVQWADEPGTTIYATGTVAYGEVDISAFDWNISVEDGQIFFEPTASGVSLATTSLIFSAGNFGEITGASLNTSETSGSAGSPTVSHEASRILLGTTGTMNAGDQIVIDFTTTGPAGVPPSVTTSAATSVTDNSATFGGEVTDEGSESVTDHGVVYSTSPIPTLSDNQTQIGTGVGAFSDVVTGLDEWTIYNVRAYATSSVGTAFGSVESFSTTGPNVTGMLNATVEWVDETDTNSFGTATVDYTQVDITSGSWNINVRDGKIYFTVTNPSELQDPSILKFSGGTFGEITGASLNTDETGTDSNGNPVDETDITIGFESDRILIGTTPQFHDEPGESGFVIDFTTSGLAGELPTVTTSTATGVTDNSATLGGEVTDEGSESVTDRGVVYSTSAIPALSDNQTQIGDGLGMFSDLVTGLDEWTIYNVRAYATSSVGTAFGSVESFTTTGPNVTGMLNATVEWADETDTNSFGTATVDYTQVDITSGSWNINVRDGKIYFTVTNPSELQDPSILKFSGGTFGEITGASLNTVETGTDSNGNPVDETDITIGFESDRILIGTTPQFHDEPGESGFVIDFTTSGLIPVVTTSSATDITPNSATLGGNVTDDRGFTVTERGIVWGTSSGPDVNDNKVQIGSDTGLFDTIVELLPSGTDIFFRAYAINSEGTAYGNEESFTTNNMISVNLEGAEGWRMLSAPAAVSLETFLGPIWTQGATSGGDTDFGDPNVYTWSASLNDWQSITNLTTTPGGGHGVLVYVFEDPDFDGPTAPGFPQPLSVMGSEHPSGTSPTMNGDPSDWTLLGNPFASAITFSELSPTNLTDIVYVWDPNDDLGDGGQAGQPTGSWKTWNGILGDLTDGHIAPFQGFLVQNNSAGGSSVTFTQASKTSTATPFLGKQPDNQIPFVRLELQGNGMRNSAWLEFTPEGSSEQTTGDALELQPLSEHYALLATRKADGSLVDIGRYSQASELEIPLITETTQPGKYTIQITDFEASGQTLYLSDLQTGQSIRLAQGARYEFTIDVSAAKAPSNPLGLIPNGIMTKQVAGYEGHRFVISSSTPENPGTETPQAFALEQNYPNPFNPTTAIRYQLPVTSQVRLEVFDMAGRQIAMLVNGQQEAGSHTVNFDGANLSSGVYMYRLHANGKVFTKKLTLIK